MSLPLLFGGYGGTCATYVDVPDGASWSAALQGGWVSFAGPSSGTGPGLLSLSAAKHTGPEREAVLTVTRPAPAEPLTWPVRQASMSALAALSDSTVQTPWATVPNVMEFGIAAKFVGAQIKKIPEPFTLIALVIAELVVVAAGILLIGARAAFTTVPEPKSWFPAPEGDPLGPLFDSLREVLPVTTVNLTLETGLTAVYLALQSLGE